MVAQTREIEKLLELGFIVNDSEEVLMHEEISNHVGVERWVFFKGDCFSGLVEEMRWVFFKGDCCFWFVGLRLERDYV